MIALAPLPHPAHLPQYIFSDGQLVGADLSPLIDMLLSTLNLPLFFPTIKCHTKLLLSMGQTPVHPVES